jgi:hypothetical protein
MPVVRRRRGKAATSPAVAMARGRAIAAVDWLNGAGHDVELAARAVDDAIGMPSGTVQRWRETSRDARKLHKAAATLVPIVTAEWTFLASLPVGFTLGGVLPLILAQLLNDRPIHVGGSTARNTSPTAVE